MCRGDVQWHCHALHTGAVLPLWLGLGLCMPRGLLLPLGNHHCSPLPWGVLLPLWLHCPHGLSCGLLLWAGVLKCNGLPLPPGVLLHPW